MLDMRDLQAQNLKALAPGVLAELAEQMLAQLQEQSQRIERQARDIKLKDVKLEKITFELARLKAWKFSAKTESMNAEQRQMFEDALAEDQADLEAQLAALKAQLPQTPGEQDKQKSKGQPRRQALPAHLRRIEHRHEPEDTVCGCGREMVRVGEDVSEKLDIVPAEFFVHRHMRSKWACKRCNVLRQEPVEPSIVDKGIPAPGLIAHTMVSRFADHIPYYRQEQINARSGVHTPRATLASWAGHASAGVAPLLEAHRTFVFGAAVLHADETPVAMLDPGSGKTKRAYVWAYARGAFGRGRPLDAHRQCTLADIYLDGLRLWLWARRWQLHRNERRDVLLQGHAGSICVAAVRLAIAAAEGMLLEPAVQHIGVHPMGAGHRGNRCPRHLAGGHQFCFELACVGPVRAPRCVPGSL